VRVCCSACVAACVLQCVCCSVCITLQCVYHSVCVAVCVAVRVSSCMNVYPTQVDVHPTESTSLSRNMWCTVQSARLKQGVPGKA